MNLYKAVNTDFKYLESFRLLTELISSVYLCLSNIPLK